MFQFLINNGANLFANDITNTNAYHYIQTYIMNNPQHQHAIQKILNGIQPIITLYEKGLYEQILVQLKITNEPIIKAATKNKLDNGVFADDKCCICLDSFNMNLKCGHAMCFKCYLDNYYIYNMPKVCPCCKNPIGNIIHMYMEMK